MMTPNFDARLHRIDFKKVGLYALTVPSLIACMLVLMLVGAAP